MTDAIVSDEDVPKPSAKLPLILGLILALLGGAAGYVAVAKGMIPGAEKAEKPAKAAPAPLGDIAFVPIDPMVISLTEEGRAQHLRFRAQLEVNAAYQDEVTLILPRVVDVLNGYLRALELDDLRDPLALTRLRAQMLRRVQIVTGEGRVRDLLIIEFVLN